MISITKREWPLSIEHSIMTFKPFFSHRLAEHKRFPVLLLERFTDWAAMDDIQNEQFKITVNILSRNLRADCLKVAVFKRVLRDGAWVNETPDKRLSGEIENAILTQARKLYRRDLAAREE